MRRTIKLLTLAAMLAAFAAPAWAQAKECNDDFKSATYQKWYDNRKDHQDVAYDAAKEYLSVCAADDSPYKTALKKFKDAYDAITASATTAKQFDDAVKNGKYAEQVRLGKQLLANDPDNVNNVKIYIILGVAGLNDPSLLSDSAQYATKAIEMIEGGKPFAPLFDGSKDKALANLNYEIAKSTVKNDPTGAIPYFVKALKPESDLKKNPQVYAQLAGAYGAGPVTKLHNDYQVFVGKDETPESKLALANLNQVIDRQIDALARAAAVATDPADKKNVMDVLTGIYKDRNKTDAGLNELVAGILQKPLPEFPTPLTSLPTPASTPATTGSPAGTNGTTSSNTTTSGQNKTGATGANGALNGNKTTGGTKASPSPTPGVKPKPRANHRRG
jgi:tetratricopeptide (TPR) repeat protein